MVDRFQNQYDKLINTIFQNVKINSDRKSFNFDQSTCNCFNKIDNLTTIFEYNKKIRMSETKNNSNKFRPKINQKIKTQILKNDSYGKTDILKSENKLLNLKSMIIKKGNLSKIKPNNKMPIMTDDSIKVTDFSTPVYVKTDYSHKRLPQITQLTHITQINSPRVTKINFTHSNINTNLITNESLKENKNKLDKAIETFLNKSKNDTTELKEKIIKEKISITKIKSKFNSPIKQINKEMDDNFKKDLKIQKNEEMSIFIYSLNKSLKVGEIDLRNNKVKKKVDIDDMLKLDNQAIFKFRNMYKDKFGMRKKLIKDNYETEKNKRNINHLIIENIIVKDEEIVEKVLKRKK